MRTLVLVVVFVLASAARADEGHMPATLAVKSVTATSTLAEKNRSYAPWQLLAPRYTNDDSGGMIIDSAWCEAKKDEGIGESVTITLAQPTKLASIGVLAGVQKSDKLYTANNRILRIDVSTDDGRAFLLEPPAEINEQGKVAIGGAPVTKVTLKIAKVKKGKYNDSCLSSVVLETDPETIPILGVDQVASNILEPNVRSISNALDSCNQKEMELVVVFPLTYRSNAWMAMGGDKIEKTFRSAADLAKACRAWQKAKPKDDDSDSPASPPVPTGIYLEYDRLTVLAEGDGAITVPIQRNELPQLWRLKWRDGSWRLTLVDY